jgi:class 3 adenylate cyclase
LNASVKELPAGTVTFLFADVEGSTRLMQSLGEGYEELLRDFRSIVRRRLGEAGGREIDTQGDAFFFSFLRARDAVSGAVAVQRDLAAHAWPGGASVRVRMGLHTGEPAVGAEGYHGLDVVRAARICSAGHGGQILASETTRALIGNNLPDGVQVLDLGRQKLKDVQHERIYQLSVDGAPARFPPLKTDTAERTGTQSRAELIAGSMEERIEDFVARQLERSLGGSGGASAVDLPRLKRKVEESKAGRRRSPAGRIVRAMWTLLLLLGAVALLLFIVRAVF